MKSILTNLVSILLLISCSPRNENLEGNWAVFDIIYEGKDISNIDDSNNSYVTNSMIVDNKNILFIINTRPKKFISTTYEYRKENKKEIIEIVDSDDKRFLGIYTLKIEQSAHSSNLKEFVIELRSSAMYINGLKYVSEL